MILTKFAERLQKGIRRSALKKRSQWAEEYRVMSTPFPGPWTFNYHPWLREMHDATNDMCIGQKAAQVGYTETMLNIVFHDIDMKQTDCLYALPTAMPDARDFSAARFNPALELSPHLTDMFTDVKNVGHKRAGMANLYVRGSRARNALKSVPAGLIILDEVEEFKQEHIPLALERASGQVESQIWMLSTPSIEKIGINKYFLESTQDHFFFKCPSCSKQIELTYPECLVVTAEELGDPRIKDSYICCPLCRKMLPHAQKPTFLKDGVWVAGNNRYDARGFYINQLYSSTVKPSKIALSVLKSEFDPAEEQELYNSKLGLPHTVDGARITDTMIQDAVGGHRIQEKTERTVFTTMGIDVGKWLHVTIDEWSQGPKTVYIGKVMDFELIDELILKFNVNSCVIDANPERRKALELAQRFHGVVMLCLYARSITGRTINIHNDEDYVVSVDRTAWLDQSLGRFKDKTIRLPMDTPLEYKEHIKASVKIYQKDANGNPVSKYINGGYDDHYGHSRNYSELAAEIGLRSGPSRNIDIQL